MLDSLLVKASRLLPTQGPAPVVTRDLEIPMADGVTLLADWYRPAGDPRLPVVLIRTCYGKSGVAGAGLPLMFTRRGMQVVIVCVRGTFGSGGEYFDAFLQEQPDGEATVNWLRQQPWCDGRVATAGFSYLGHTQWAMASTLEPPLSAMALGITGSEFTSSFYPGGVLALDTLLNWSALLGTQEHRSGLPNPRQTKRTENAKSHLPLIDADVEAIGKRVPFFGNVVSHCPPDTGTFWAPAEHDAKLSRLDIPISMVTGWYDVFLQRQLADFTALQSAGAQVKVQIGAWSHGEPASLRTLIGDQVDFLGDQLGRGSNRGGERAVQQRRPVRLYLQHSGRWLDFDAWPPTESSTRALHLHPHGRVSFDAVDASTPGAAVPERFRYDPADPTPAVGGPLLMGKSKQRPNNDVEARDDVCVFTSAAREAHLDLIGELRGIIYVRTSLPDADVYVRLCDVDTKGVSHNVCDGILRLSPAGAAPDADGIVCAELRMDPTAYRFRTGHRLRVQVAGGAFPRFARNHGTGEAQATAVRLQANDFEILHDAEHPSRIEVPVYDDPSTGLAPMR